MKEIEVYDIERNEIVTILESDYDESKHRKLERKDEAKREENGGGDDISATITAAAGEIATSVKEAVRASLKDVSVDRSKVAASVDVERDASRSTPDRIDEGSSRYGEALRALPGWERQYDRLPEYERQYRSPAGDVQVQRWAKAMCRRDPQHDSAVLREILDAQMQTGGNLNELDRAITTGGASGGPLVPSPLATAIAMKRDAKERIAPNAFVTMSTSQTLDLPAEGTNLVTGGGVAEGATISEDTVDFAQLQLSKKKWAARAAATWEQVNDMSMAFSLVNILSSQAGRALATYYDTQSAADGDGTGTNHTLALEEASIGTVASTSGALTRTIVSTLKMGLPSAWRDNTNCVLMGNSTLTGWLSELVDLSGRPIYDFANNPARGVGDVGNAVGIVEGLPYLEVPLATNLFIVGVLDEGFAVLDEPGIRVDVSDQAGTSFQEDEIWYRFVARRDSGVWLTDAFRTCSNPVLAPA